MIKQEYNYVTTHGNETEQNKGFHFEYIQSE